MTGAIIYNTALILFPMITISMLIVFIHGKVKKTYLSDRD